MGYSSCRSRTFEYVESEDEQRWGGQGNATALDPEDRGAVGAAAEHGTALELKAVSTHCRRLDLVDRVHAASGRVVQEPGRRLRSQDGRRTREVGKAALDQTSAAADRLDQIGVPERRNVRAGAVGIARLDGGVGRPGGRGGLRQLG